MKRIDRIGRTLASAAVLILAGTAAYAQVQLDDRCTISVLNRTAQVRSDGTWTISDVPSNLGLVRARATCQENGVTYEGVSDYFVVPTNGVIGVSPKGVLTAVGVGTVTCASSDIVVVSPSRP